MSILIRAYSRFAACSNYTSHCSRWGHSWLKGSFFLFLSCFILLLLLLSFSLFTCLNFTKDHQTTLFSFLRLSLFLFKSCLALCLLTLSVKVSRFPGRFFGNGSRFLHETCELDLLAYHVRNRG